MQEHYENTVTDANSRFDQVLVLFLGLFTLAPVVMILLTTLGVMSVQSWAQNWPAALLGTLLTLLGLLSGYYCRRALGASWTPAVKVENDHHIVDTGPYNMVRHPIYTTMLIMFLGITIVFPTWWTWIVYILLVVSYGLKADAEEKLLVEGIAEYSTYMQRVRYRLIPGLW